MKGKKFISKNYRESNLHSIKCLDRAGQRWKNFSSSCLVNKKFKFWSAEPEKVNK